METYEIKLENDVNLKILDDNMICLYGNEDSSNYFINIDNLLKEISKKKYDDEYFIEKAIYTEKVQQGKTYTFYKNEFYKNEIEKYNWCQRPCDTNMSLRKFEENATISCYMSESLAEEYGLEQIDLNTFIWKFVHPILEENIKLKEKFNNTISIKTVLDMLEELDKKRDDCKSTDNYIAGYYSKRAMLKKLLKQAGFDYKKYKELKENK